MTSVVSFYTEDEPKMSAKSGNLAPFMSINYAKFQKSAVKRLENISIFVWYLP